MFIYASTYVEVSLKKVKAEEAQLPGTIPGNIQHSCASFYGKDLEFVVMRRIYYLSTQSTGSSRGPQKQSRCIPFFVSFSFLHSLTHRVFIRRLAGFKVKLSRKPVIWHCVLFFHRLELSPLDLR